MSKRKLKQKQTQKQSVVQKVIIRLDSSGKKIKRKFRIKKRSEPQMYDERYYRQLPPPTVIQNVYQELPRPQPTPISIPKTIGTINPSLKITEFQDIGVGTEGFVEILDFPTKKEMMEEFITPVMKKEKKRRTKKEIMPIEDVEKEAEMTRQEKINWDWETINPSQQITPFQDVRKGFVKDIEPIPESEPFLIKPVRTRRTKKEMTENRMMEREDIASISLGLSQYNAFNPQFVQKSISEREANSVSGITTREPSSRITESISDTISEISQVSIGKRGMERGRTWDSLLKEYEDKTGEKLTIYKANKKFGSKEGLKEFLKNNKQQILR